ncbi:MAG: efflux RND transporter periplasmic adaptor subunit [Candidatus Omnitrophica bacterium]|nr:efflux RND transporter periplasmic adaptor subunit [Candidatus Omnitrophota bacterium]
MPGLIKIIERISAALPIDRVKVFFKKILQWGQAAWNDPKRRKRYLKSAIWILAAFMVLSRVKGCIERELAKHIPPRPVRVSAVSVEDVPVHIDSFGTLNPLNNTDVKSQVTGEVKEIHFTDGADVKTGDMLFTIDPALYQAEYDKSQALLKQDEIDLKLKKDTLERNQQLVAKSLISLQDLERYETDVESAEAKLALDKAAAEQSRINLDYCFIKSSIDGLTGKRQVDIGNIVAANTGPTLVNIKTIDRLYVDFPIPERGFDSVREAAAKSTLKVEVWSDSGQLEPAAGELIFLDNAIDYSTGTVMLRALIDNSDRRFWAGEFVRVKLITETAENALVVPYDAVQFGQKGLYVFVVKTADKTTTADLRQVTTGIRNDDMIVITSGVYSSDTVVISGQLQLRQGIPVQVVKDSTQDQPLTVNGQQSK